MDEVIRGSLSLRLVLPRGHTLTAFDQNPILQLVSWLIIALTSLTFGFRLLTRAYLKPNHALGWEDVLITIAFILGIGESITVIIPQGAIVGRRLADISEQQLTTGMKIGYARDLLFLLSAAFAKLSVCASFVSLSPDRKHRRLTYILAMVIVLWALTSLFITAFQCGVKHPWDTRGPSCVFQQAFLQYVAIVNISTDFGLLALPVMIIYPLHMELKTRLIIISFFSYRLLVIIATICQLVYLPGLFQDDFTFQSFPYYISVQLAQFTSLFAACAVYFWPLLRSLRSGLIWINDVTFSQQYTLKTLTTPDSRRLESNGVPNDASTNRNRRNYVRITTDISLSMESGQGQGLDLNIVPRALLAPVPDNKGT